MMRTAKSTWQRHSRSPNSTGGYSVHARVVLVTGASDRLQQLSSTYLPLNMHSWSLAEVNHTCTTHMHLFSTSSLGSRRIFTHFHKGTTSWKKWTGSWDHCGYRSRRCTRQQTVRFINRSPLLHRTPFIKHSVCTAELRVNSKTNLDVTLKFFQYFTYLKTTSISNSVATFATPNWTLVCQSTLLPSPLYVYSCLCTILKMSRTKSPTS